MFVRTIRSLRHFPAASMADIAFILLIFFLTSVHFHSASTPPLIIADPAILSESSTSIHILLYPSDHSILSIQDGDTTSLNCHALVDSAKEWVRRDRHTVVVLRSNPGIPARYPLAMISLLREAGINGVVLGELDIHNHEIR